MNAQHRRVADNPTPLVSCIMPTANRPLFAFKAIEYFLRQDYPNRELVIVDDGEDELCSPVRGHPSIHFFRLTGKYRLGTKRNIACDKAMGEVIIHWDDDDWMSDQRITYQVNALIKLDVELCGQSKLIFFNPATNKAWRFHYPLRNNCQLLAGASMCYYRKLWERQPFEDINVGEDTRFIWNNEYKKMYAINDADICVAINHHANTSPRITVGERWRDYPLGCLRKLMDRDWNFYRDLAARHVNKPFCAIRGIGL